MSSADIEMHRSSPDYKPNRESKPSPTYRYDNQYGMLINKILTQGKWVKNDRTGLRCLTLSRADFKYDASQDFVPGITTRLAPIKAAIREVTGYIRGINNSNDFEDQLDVITWHANANENESWLNNPHRKGDGDMGQAYRFRPVGYVPMLKRSPDDSMIVKASYEGEEEDQVRRIYEMLCKGEDDRGLIANAWKPETFDKACLRPCMYKWHFTLIDGVLDLHVEQRSVDTLLGLVSNMVQAYYLCRIFAQITGNKPGMVYHTLINCHIYENQYDVLLQEKQMARSPYPSPRLVISDEIKTLEDLETLDLSGKNFDKYFQIKDYQHHPQIKYPFAV